MRLVQSPSRTALILAIAIVTSMADLRVVTLILIFSWWWEHVCRVVLREDSDGQQEG